MYKPFNNYEAIKLMSKYNDKDLECAVFEEQSCEESKEELSFNLIAIEFSNSPFDTEDRRNKFKYIDWNGEHYGYMVDISKDTVNEVNLLIHGLGWGETEKVLPDTEEFSFVQSILRQAGVLK